MAWYLRPYTNLMICFTNMETRKSDPVVQIVFVNIHVHGYHYKNHKLATASLPTLLLLL